MVATDNDTDNDNDNDNETTTAATTTAATGTATAATTATPTLLQPEPYQQRLVDWIHSGKNGFFHPAVVWKRLGPGGNSGSYAMHTTRDIPKGETLLVVPRSHTIDSFKTHNTCVTVARMLHEYEMGDASFFAPYISYLFDDTVGGTSTGLLPGAWSSEGQDLLEYILGSEDDEGTGELEGLEPSEYEQPSVFEECNSTFRATNQAQPLEDETLRQRAEDAYRFMVSRSWDDKMIPVLDMYNHRNGVSKNVEATTVHYNDDDITAYAFRDIQAGEQLQYTYSECMDDDCSWGRMRYEYLTGEMFTDYGFVELYPRRWELGPSGDEVIAEVDRDLQTGQKIFRWIFEAPSAKTLEWISKHLERLRTIEDKVRRGVADHVIVATTGTTHHNMEHERDSLLELYEGYVEILQLALEHKNDPIGVTRQQFNEILKNARQEVKAKHWYPHSLDNK